MTVLTQIPGFDLASELFKNVVITNVSVPTDTVWGDSWYNYLQHREKALNNYLRDESSKSHLGFENKPLQMKQHIQSELAEIAHLNLAVKGYPFKLGDLSFLSDSKEQDNYKWPVFVPLDVKSPDFQIKVRGYDNYVEIMPYTLHPEIKQYYQRSVENLKEIRRKSGQDSVSIHFTNMTSPPDWARNAINNALSSGLFSQVYILIDHSTIPWQITNGDTVIDIADMHRREALAKEAEQRWLAEIRRGGKIFVDPMVIGLNTYSRTFNGFGEFATSSWSVIALYDPSKHEQYVYDQFALSPKNF